MRKGSLAKTGKYRVAITADVMEEGGFAFFSNGLRQNVFFLCRMFNASPNCIELYLLTNRPAPLLPEAFGFDHVKVHLISELAQGIELDAIIIAGTAVDPGLLRDQRAKGVKTIFYKAGNAAIISIEASISKEPDRDGERYGDYDCFDEIWMTPQHEHTYKGWCETIYRCPVRIIPQIWDPSFLQLQQPQIIETFGYKPGKSAWKVGIMDPNITVMKTSHIPAMVCEHAFRMAPTKFDAFYITNSIQHASHPHFSGFVTQMEAYKAKKMTVEGRFVTWEFLATFVDAVVTHHWENGLNYLYYEVLYGGYPLIHNSEFLKDYGYYYESFEPEIGGKVLVEAVKSHDLNLEAYKAKAATLIDGLSPLAKSNIDLHEGLILELIR